MASSVDIANSALTKLGEARITSLTDDVKAAREINAIFELRRDALLRAFNWNFAMKRAQLSASADAPSWGYTLQYQLPADCLRMIQVGEYYVIPGLSDYIGGTDTELFKIEGRTIVTDLSAPLKVRYTQKVTNTGLFDALFVEVFASDLAMQTAWALTQSNSKKQDAREDKRVALLEAIRANAIELPPQAIQDDSWIMSRL